MSDLVYVVYSMNVRFLRKDDYQSKAALAREVSRKFGVSVLGRIVSHTPGHP